MREAAPAGAPLRWLRHRRELRPEGRDDHRGADAARDWIATLDGDGQNDPADIPALLEQALARDAENGGRMLVAGHRVRRQDGTIKRLTSDIANSVRARLLGDGTPDTGCGLKVFRRDTFLALPHFDHMHRFLAGAVPRAGGRVVSVPVNHRARRLGRSNYGTLGRLGVGIFDVAGLLWLQRRWTRPEIENSGEIEALETSGGAKGSSR